MTDSKSFTVKVGDFEGPMDLLLHLIERRKLHISDVSLAEITDEYLSAVRELQECSSEDLSDFIYTAATLMLIKSTWLLPGTKTTEDEQASIRDLESRLEIYKKVRAYSKHISSQYGRKKMFPRGEDRSKIHFSMPSYITAETLSHNIQICLSTLPRELLRPQKKIQKTLSIEDAVNGIINRIEKNMTAYLEEIPQDSKNKISVIVHFLAALELMKRGALFAEQAEPFGAIKLDTRKCTVPRYE